MSVNLFISLYPEKDKKRQAELHTCLMNNLKSGIFDAVWIIAEDDGKGLKYLPDVNPYKVNVLPCSKRPTFRTFFNVINEVTVDSNIFGFYNINILANADIFFESLPIIPRDNQVFALTRYDIDKNNNATFVNRKDCTDTWVFNGKIKIPKYSEFWFGIPGCDNRLNWELMNIGYEVLNPSLTIRTYHLHSGEKSYDGTKKIGKPYHFLIPTK